jgi:MFS family permease
LTQGADRAAAPRSPLDYREFRELWGANAASNFGTQIQVVGAAWLMASLTSSPQLIALVQTAIYLPTMLFILPGGAIADNYDRRGVMLFTQSAMLGLAALLAVLTWFERITPVSLLALMFAIGACGSFNNPCWHASVRDILPRTQISRAVALNSVSMNLARTLGPALGGLIVALTGAAFAFAANAISFVGFIVALARWRPVCAPRATPRERIMPAIMVGMRYVVLAPAVRNAVVRGGLSGLSASAAFALLPVLARQEMGGDATLYGLLLGAFGLGAVVSAWLGAWLRCRLAPDQVLGGAVIALTLGMAVLASAPMAGVAGLGAGLCGAGWVLAHSTFNTIVQLSAPAWVAARALAFYQTATFAGLAAGSALLGWVAEQHSVAIAFFAASIAQALAGMAGLVLRLPRPGALKIEPLSRWREPSLSVTVGADDGPIVIELDYRIAPHHKQAFLQAMRDRKRIRQRDGALDWSLNQDLSDAARWTERYRVPSWADYLRHMDRRTVADLDNTALLRGLRDIASGVRVRRYRQHRL